MAFRADLLFAPATEIRREAFSTGTTFSWPAGISLWVRRKHSCANISAAFTANKFFAAEAEFHRW
jgi:hypothetical protein